MRQFHRQLVEALKAFSGKLGEVEASYDDVAARMGGGVTGDDVHQGLIHLNDEGYFPGDPMLTSDLVVVRLPDGGSEFRQALLSELRGREDSMGRVSASYEEIAIAIGASADEVHQALIHLNDDGYFESDTMLTSDLFACRLPEAE